MVWGGKEGRKLLRVVRLTCLGYCAWSLLHIERDHLYVSRIVPGMWMSWKSSNFVSNFVAVPQREKFQAGVGVKYLYTLKPK